MGKISVNLFEGQNFQELSGNGQMDRLFMVLKKKLNQSDILTLLLGYIHVYDHYKQVYLYISQISGE